MAYDYRKAVKEDVLKYIRNEINLEDFDTLEELEEHLNETLWTVDSVTGNGSGFCFQLLGRIIFFHFLTS